MHQQNSEVPKLPCGERAARAVRIRGELSALLTLLTWASEEREGQGARARMRIIRGSTSGACHGSDTMHEAQWAGPEGHWVASCGRGARGAGESGRGASRDGKQGRRQKHVMARARAADERERKRRHADEPGRPPGAAATRRPPPPHDRALQVSVHIFFSSSLCIREAVIGTRGIRLCVH